MVGRRLTSLLLAALTVLAMFAPASATADAQNRVLAFHLAAHTHAPSPTAKSPWTRLGSSLATPKSAAGCCVAANEAPRFTQRTASGAFAHGPFAGRSIGGVASGLRAGSISPSDLPIEVIRRGGETLTLNTRSTLALKRGGVDPADWVVRDVTGNAARERLLTERLARNGLDDGTDVLRVTGAGKDASSTR